MGDFNVTSRPVEMKYYTAKEIVKLSGLSIAQIYRFLRQGNFKSELVQTPQGKRPMYSWSACKTIVEYAKVTKMNKQKKKVETVEPTIEQLRKEHPLVEDDRFFKLSYFPDPIPVGFYDD